MRNLPLSAISLLKNHGGGFAVNANGRSNTGICDVRVYRATHAHTHIPVSVCMFTRTSPSAMCMFARSHGSANPALLTLPQQHYQLFHLLRIPLLQQQL
eukprot:gene5058-34852_t